MLHECLLIDGPKGQFCGGVVFGKRMGNLDVLGMPMNMTSDGKFVVCPSALNLFGRLRSLIFSITKTRCGGKKKLTGNICENLLMSSYCITV